MRSPSLRRMDDRDTRPACYLASERRVLQARRLRCIASPRIAGRVDTRYLASKEMEDGRERRQRRASTWITERLDA